MHYSHRILFVIWAIFALVICVEVWVILDIGGLIREDLLFFVEIPVETQLFDLNFGILAFWANYADLETSRRSIVPAALLSFYAPFPLRSPACSYAAS